MVRDIRRKKNLSQQQVAGKVGISRASYIALEKGTREVRLSEAGKLADILGMTVSDLLNGATPNVGKYRQMLLAFLRQNLSKDRKVPKTKLAKLLYLADFGWYYNHLESMSGMRYRKIPYGPVPDLYFRIVDELYEEGKLNIEEKDGTLLISQTQSGKREPVSMLSTQEKQFITAIARKWKNKRTQEIVDFTHSQIPYRFCEDGEYIPYELITQEDPGYAY